MGSFLIVSRICEAQNPFCEEVDFGHLADAPFDTSHRGENGRHVRGAIGGARTGPPNDSCRSPAPGLGAKRRPRVSGAAASWAAIGRLTAHSSAARKAARMLVTGVVQVGTAKPLCGHLVEAVRLPLANDTGEILRANTEFE